MAKAYQVYAMTLRTVEPNAEDGWRLFGESYQRLDEVEGEVALVELLRRCRVTEQRVVYYPSGRHFYGVVTLGGQERRVSVTIKDDRGNVINHTDAEAEALVAAASATQQ